MVVMVVVVVVLAAVIVVAVMVEVVLALTASSQMRGRWARIRRMFFYSWSGVEQNPG